jgi:ssDNA-binding replication factor A large subunit
MLLSELRPGMEDVNLKVTLKNLENERIVTAHSGIQHRIVEGFVEDSSGSLLFTVWNDRIDELNGIKSGDELELIGCFISSYKGVLSVNVGRNSEIHKIE